MKKKLINLYFLIFTIFSYAQHQTIYTDNGYIYKQNGEKIVIRGMNYNFLDDGNIVMKGNSQSYKKYIDQVALTGSNSIRIPWFTDNFDHWRKKYPENGSPQEALENGKLSEVLSYCNSKGLIPILELHDFTCKNNWTTFITETQNFWLQPSMLELIQRHKEYLIINIANEFGTVRWASNPSSALNNYKNNYKQLIINFRKAGIDIPIMIDAPDCGQSSSEMLSVAPDILTADPLKKLIFSGHAYWYGYAPTTNDVNVKIDEITNSKIPFVFGEVANRQDVSSNRNDGVYNIDYVYQTILEKSCQKDISWLIWAFNHDWHSERKISSTSNINNLTNFGKDVLYNSKYGLLTNHCKESSLSTPSINIENDKIRIYPNPAKNFLHVTNHNKIKEAYVFDSSGRQLMIVKNNFEHIDVSQLPIGNYFLKILLDHKTIVESFTVTQ